MVMVDGKVVQTWCRCGGSSMIPSAMVRTRETVSKPSLARSKLDKKKWSRLSQLSMPRFTRRIQSEQQSW